MDEERGTGPGPVEEIVAEVKIAEVGEYKRRTVYEERGKGGGVGLSSLEQWRY